MNSHEALHYIFPDDCWNILYQNKETLKTSLVFPFFFSGKKIRFAAVQNFENFENF